MIGAVVPRLLDHGFRGSAERPRLNWQDLYRRRVCIQLTAISSRRADGEQVEDGTALTVAAERVAGSSRCYATVIASRGANAGQAPAYEDMDDGRTS